jgi:hypothetical protein
MTDFQRIPEKVVPNAEARSAILEANMVNDVLLRNSPEIIRNLDMACDSKSFASRVWNEIVYSTRVGRKEKHKEMFLRCSIGDEYKDRYNNANAVYRAYEVAMDKLLAKTKHLREANQND